LLDKDHADRAVSKHDGQAIKDLMARQSSGDDSSFSNNGVNECESITSSDKMAFCSKSA